jgi:uncharacterized protein YjbI with pentapeptide repeats
MTAAAMAANPSALSGKRITCDIDGDFVLENAVIKRATFANSKIWRSIIRNVTFEDCTFSQTHFMTTDFENVTFKGGSISYRPNPRYEADDTSFEDIMFYNVVMDNVALNEAYFQLGCGDTNLTLRNLTRVRNKYTTFTIYNAKLVIDNCKASGDFLALLDGKDSTLYVNNCEFRKLSGIGGVCKAAYIRNSKFLNFSFIGGGYTTVIENSVLTGQIGNGVIRQLYLINNQYLPSGNSRDPWIGRAVLQANTDGKVFLDGQNVKNAYLTVTGGSIYIRDLECVYFILASPADDLTTRSLDLSNVVISGLRLRNLDLKSVRWQNVTVNPPVILLNSKIANFQAYNVSYPRDGTLESSSDGNSIKITQSKLPFDFPPIIAPTPEALGVRIE